jgi:hypothetical protein
VIAAEVAPGAAGGVDGGPETVARVYCGRRRRSMDMRLRSHMDRTARLALLTIAAAGIARCSSAASPLPPSGDTLAVGTWGGENAGVIVGDTTAHVHVGCTYGDFPAPVALDPGGRFNVAGSYRLRAYPIAVGPAVPAQFAGLVAGAKLTLTVTVEDTVEHKMVVLGPATVTYGRAPRLGPCPICRKPRGTP